MIREENNDKTLCCGWMSLTAYPPVCDYFMLGFFFYVHGPIE